MHVHAWCQTWHVVHLHDPARTELQLWEVPWSAWATTHFFEWLDCHTGHVLCSGPLYGWFGRVLFREWDAAQVIFRTTELQIALDVLSRYPEYSRGRYRAVADQLRAALAE